MNFKQFISESNAVARTNALKKQQELVDAGYENVEVTKHGPEYGDVYQLVATKSRALIFNEVQIWFCTNIRTNKFNKQLEEIKNDAGLALKFAIDILGYSRFPVGELAISKKAHTAFSYAETVLKGPFPAGEPAIAVHPQYAYMYAHHLLQASFPAGERAIAQDAKFSYEYAKDVLKGPFPAGEKAIARKAIYAYLYAIDVLNAPFPAGEQQIITQANLWHNYKAFCSRVAKNDA